MRIISLSVFSKPEFTVPVTKTSDAFRNSTASNDIVFVTFVDITHVFQFNFQW
jgi:hypothetical protein